jgi:hypothetical protein
MTDRDLPERQPADVDGLTDQELAAQTGQSLPDREAMSTISTDLMGIDNFAMPINEALAMNIQSTDSVAIADADQTVIIGQVDTDIEEGSS